MLKPKFDVHEFIKNFKGKKIKIPRNKMIPEVKAYFKALEIPRMMLNEIETLDADGGDEIYLNLTPEWDGEDDLFSVNSAEDAEMLPNLTRVNLLYSDNDNLAAEFEELGIEVGS